MEPDPTTGPTCPNCGRAIAPGAHFCPSCGAEIPAAAVAPAADSAASAEDQQVADEQNETVPFPDVETPPQGFPPPPPPMATAAPPPAPSGPPPFAAPAPPPAPDAGGFPGPVPPAAEEAASDAGALPPPPPPTDDTAATSPGQTVPRPPTYPAPTSPPGYVATQGAYGVAPVSGKRVTAGVLGILLGAWGIHRFYLGDTMGGILRIVITLFTCGIGGVIGLIEGIIYLTKTDQEFDYEYLVQRKEWF